MKRCVLSLERNIGREDKFRVSGGSKFQSCGPMTEKALMPRNDLTYGMERTSESEDCVETECDRNSEMCLGKVQGVHFTVTEFLKGPEMLLKVDCLPIAFGKQPSILLINLERKWTLS